MVKVILVFSDHSYDPGPELEVIIPASQKDTQAYQDAIKNVLENRKHYKLIYSKEVEIDPSQGIALEKLNIRPINSEYVGIRVIYAVDERGEVVDVLGHMNHWGLKDDFFARNEGRKMLFNVLPRSVDAFRGAKIISGD